MSGFDWSHVHDFDPSEAGRNTEQADQLAAAFLTGSDIPEPPERLR